MITRRAFIQTGIAAAAAVPLMGATGVVSAATPVMPETPLSDYAKMFQQCKSFGLNVALSGSLRSRREREVLRQRGISEYVIQFISSNHGDVGYKRNIARNALDELGMTYRIISAALLDPSDLELPSMEGVIQSNILDGEDAIILDDYSMAMPRVRNMLTHKMLARKDTLFIVVANEYGDIDETLVRTNRFVSIDT